MPDQLTNNPEALRLFFTEDVFLVEEESATQVKELPAAIAAQAAESDLQQAQVPLTQVHIPSMQTAHLAENKVDTEPAAASFKYVGANERNILILVYDTVNPVSSIAGRQLLGMILKSIKLDRNDCALVNYASCNGADFTQLKAFFKPQYVFAFGITPTELGLPESASNSIINHDDTNLIFSINLDALSDDMATKKLLWASLKQIELI